MNFKKYLYSLFSFFFFFFLLAEIYLRSGLDEKTEYGYLSSVMKKDDNLGFKFIPNGKFKLEKNSVSFNKYGYIGNDWEKEKDTSVYRIAIVGTCNLTGVFHIIDSEVLNFPELSEKELIDKGFQVEILNFGIPGENRSYYQYKTVSEEVIQFNPDLVVMEYNLPLTKQDYVRDEYKGYQLEYLANSITSERKVLEWANKLDKYKYLTYLIDNVLVVRAISKKYQQAHNNDMATFIKFAIKNQISFIDQAVTGYYTLEKSSSLIKELKDVLNNKDISFNFLIYNLNDEGVNFFNDNNFKYINLNCETSKEMFYPEDDHLNNIGQNYLKEQFVNEIIKIIPSKYKKY